MNIFFRNDDLKGCPVNKSKRKKTITKRQSFVKTSATVKPGIICSVKNFRTNTQFSMKSMIHVQEVFIKNILKMKPQILLKVLIIISLKIHEIYSGDS